MRRAIIIAAVYIFAATATAWATVYEMVMSKDETLCPIIFSSLNEDLTKRGEIHYATHKVTPAITWRRMAELGSPLKDTECEQFRWAKFDINNDGKEDLVVKYSRCLDERLNDALYFFEAKYQGLKAVRTAQEFFKDYGVTGIGHLKLRGYFLNELPASHESFGDEQIRTELVLNPFRFNNVTYLHIDPMMPNQFNSYLHVVSKYEREALPPLDKRQSDPIQFGQNPKGLQDVCYFKMKGSEYRVVERREDGLVLRP